MLKAQCEIFEIATHGLAINNYRRLFVDNSYPRSNPLYDTFIYLFLLIHIHSSNNIFDFPKKKNNVFDYDFGSKLFPSFPSQNFNYLAPNFFAKNPIDREIKT
jgi:hypothetical protein